MAELNLNQAPRQQNFIASVLFAEIAGYADRPVFEQIQYTTRMRQMLERAVAQTDSQDVLVIDREESVALLFRGDPLECFALAKHLSEILQQQDTHGDLPVYVGVNLGPVTVSRNELSVAQVSGAGVDDAARVARAGLLREVLISRAYYTVFARISKDYGLLQYREFISDDMDESFAIYQLGSESDRTDVPPLSQAETLPLAAARAGHGWRYAAASAVVAVGAFALYQNQPVESAQKVRAQPSRVSKLEAPAKPIVRPATSAAIVAVEPMPSPLEEPAQIEQTAQQIAENDTDVAVGNLYQAIGSGEKLFFEAPGQPIEPVALTQELKTATLRLAIKPWGEVYVDGKKVGVTPPLHKIKLAPGKRQIVVRNADFLPYRVTFDIQPESLLQISHQFDK
jgi:hypothetical protein